MTIKGQRPADLAPGCRPWASTSCRNSHEGRGRLPRLFSRSATRAVYWWSRSTIWKGHAPLSLYAGGKCIQAGARRGLASPTRLPPFSKTFSTHTTHSSVCATSTADRAPIDSLRPTVGEVLGKRWTHRPAVASRKGARAASNKSSSTQHPRVCIHGLLLLLKALGSPPL